MNVLDVEMVVIGGGLGSRLGEPYVERIREAMMPHLFVSDRPPAVRPAGLGDLGGAIGASLLVKGRARGAPGPAPPPRTDPRPGARRGSRRSSRAGSRGSPSGP